MAGRGILQAIAIAFKALWSKTLR